MELIVKGSFYRDISNFKDKELLDFIYDVINELAAAKELNKIKNLKKLKEYETLYRIKIAKDYRLGIIVRGNKIWLVSFAHRSNFYKNFP